MSDTLKEIEEKLREDAQKRTPEERAENVKRLQAAIARIDKKKELNDG